MSAKKPKKRGPGMPAGTIVKPPSERTRSINSSYPAEIAVFFEKIGGGSASRGARIAARFAYSMRHDPYFSPFPITEIP